MRTPPGRIAGKRKTAVSAVFSLGGLLEDGPSDADRVARAAAGPKAVRRRPG
ncbi:MAG: hypothetical protein HSCHL_0568 [Hydrogenibacillus schlegelii]|uniref:Uncharacterized protein n=1 Tax=Hydrogenibacillus schlegelii TaxID=1484 RepID=A0A2T5GDM8_HYDSH|nr:MAG: hypothetical protein HSCHL_0568 [Hydrogenibacillus schlegelii]